MLPRPKHQLTPHTLAPENPSESEKLIPGRKHAPSVPYEVNTYNAASVKSTDQPLLPLYAITNQRQIQKQ
jgi:hypothetical protein